MQRSLWEFVAKEQKEECSIINNHCKNSEFGNPNRPQFVDLFCGIGGASQGAVEAGYDVCLAVDSCKDALKIHRQNHKNTIHHHCKLPSKDPLPLPDGSVTWHLHGSPPCTDVSIANQNRDEEKRQSAIGLIEWYIKFAVSSTASSWSMEQVPTPIVKSALDTMLKPGSEFHSKFSYVVIDMSEFGVPQMRKRLIAGSNKLISRFKGIAKWRRGVRDVIPRTRGTHVRNNVYFNGQKINRMDENGEAYFGYQRWGPDDLCIPVSKPGYTVTASHTLSWATPGSGKKLISMTHEETLLMQTFPSNYKLHGKKVLRGIGNAVPPLIMKQLLTGVSGRWSGNVTMEP